MARTSCFSLLALLLWVSPAFALPGPPLREPRASLAQALMCPDGLRGAPKTPVLLVHGTGATFEENFGGNYLRFLAGRPVCTVSIPDRAVGDLQRNVEFVVHAIRAMAAERRGKVSVISHSQGATLATFAMKWWPDLALKVDDLIGFAGAYDRGTAGADVICTSEATCTPAFTQFKPGSAFLGAFRARPLPQGPSYTAYATKYDMIITPAPLASRLEGARNFVLQDLCPLDSAEHLSIVAEAPLLALTLDALDHRGPADAGRAGPLPCGFAGSAAAEMLGALPTFASGFAQEAYEVRTTTEPELRCPFAEDCERPRFTPRLRVRIRVGRTAGRLILPAGAVEPCGGRVAVHVKQGRRVVRSALSRVRRTCRFSAPVGRPGRVNVRYRGTPELRPVAVRPQPGHQRP